MRFVKINTKGVEIRFREAPSFGIEPIIRRKFYAPFSFVLRTFNFRSPRFVTVHVAVMDEREEIIESE